MTVSDGQKRALHLATHSGWYRFERHEDTWVQIDRALTYWLMSCLQIDPDDANRVYLGTEHSGMFVSRDGGKEWLRASPNVPCLTLSSLLAMPGKLLAGTMPAALYELFDGHWQELSGVRNGATGGTFPPNPDLAARTRVLTAEKRPGGRLYAGIEVGGILISDDGGGRWSMANDGLEDPDIHQILPSKKTGGLVITACGEGVFRSRDRGDHWEKVTPPGKRTYGNALAEDDNGTVYLGITLDRPRTWTRSGRADGAIYKSSDGGTNWDLMLENISGGIMDICVDSQSDGILIATAEGEVLHAKGSDSRSVINGLPCITGLALGA